MLTDYTRRVVWVAIHLKHRLDDLLRIAKYKQFHAQTRARVLCRKQFKQ